VVQFRSPAPFVSFVLATVSGTLLATGALLSGAIVGVIAIVMLGLWRFAVERSDDDRHTLL
jgi:hypothetical protein